MADATRLAQLIVNRLLGTISPSEEAELADWINESPENEAFIENEIRPVVLAQDLLTLTEMDEEALDEKVWAEIEQHISSENAISPPKPQKRSKTRLIGMLVAAAIITFLLIKTLEKPALPEVLRTHTDIWQSQSTEITKPTQRPTLTLSKDLVVDLNTIPEGKMAGLGRWLILKVGSQHIAYVRTDNTETVTTLPDSVYNVISLPPGTGTWQITLPDRSKVSLYQGSSLSFSVNPAGRMANQRSAALNGEAFFEVEHNAQSPFVLETNKGEIKVRGTSFSVRDYQEETSAVILQYAGRLEISKENKPIFLDSAQRATIDPAAADIFIDNNVNLPPHPASQLETFDFSRQNLVSALNEVAQYYRIPKIHIDQQLDTTRKLRMGTVPKDLPLDQLLAQLEQNDMHFKATENMITVTK